MRHLRSILALSISASLLAGCLESPSSLQQEPSPLRAVLFTATQEPIKPVKVVLGKLQSPSSIQIRARTSGFIETKGFRDGDWVNQGEILYEVEKEDLRLAAEYAKAQELSAKATLDNALSEEARIRGLFKAHAVSQQALDRAISELGVAQAQYSAAIASRRIADKQLSDSTILAPFSGVLGKSNVFVGDLVSPQSESLVQLTQIDPMWVNFSLSTQEFKDLFPAMKAFGSVEVKREDGRVLTGEIVYQSSVIDPSLGSIALRAQLDNPDKTLLPGEYVKVIVSGQEGLVFLVPQHAVQKVSNGHVLMTLKEGTAQASPVQVGQWRGSDWVIREGLSEGDVVITSNLLKVRPGAPVLGINTEQPTQERGD